MGSSVLELRFSGLEPFVWDKEVHIRASSLAKLTVHWPSSLSCWSEIDQCTITTESSLYFITKYSQDLVYCFLRCVFQLNTTQLDP